MLPNFMHALYEHRFTDALNMTTPILPDDVMQLVHLLSNMFGNRGYLSGNIGVLVGRVVDWIDRRLTECGFDTA